MAFHFRLQSEREEALSLLASARADMDSASGLDPLATGGTSQGHIGLFIWAGSN